MLKDIGPELRKLTGGDDEGWMQRCADRLGVTRAEVFRWATGRRKVGRFAAESMLARLRGGSGLPPIPDSLEAYQRCEASVGECFDLLSDRGRIGYIVGGVLAALPDDEFLAAVGGFQARGLRLDRVVEDAFGE